SVPQVVPGPSPVGSSAQVEVLPWPEPVEPQPQIAPCEVLPGPSPFGSQSPVLPCEARGPLPVPSPPRVLPPAVPGCVAAGCQPAECCQEVLDAPAGRLWARGEYLLWWIRDSHLPPLVTISPVGSAGILGRPGTAVLIGGSGVDNEERSGGRFEA